MPGWGVTAVTYSRTWWQDVKTTLHWPRATIYMTWVLIGSFAAPVVHLDRLVWSLVALFLYLVVASYALDELRGRHCGTQLSRLHLKARVYGGMVTATTIGGYLSLTISWTLFPLLVGGIVMLWAYNWEVLGTAPRRLTFGFAWGSFPMLSHYYLHALTAPPLWLWVMAVAAAIFSFHHVGMYGNTGCRVWPVCLDFQERGRLHPGQADWLCHGQRCSVRRALLSMEDACDAGRAGVAVHRHAKSLALHEMYFCALLAAGFVVMRVLGA